MPKTKRIVPIVILAAMLSSIMFALACGTTETVVQTVVVEKAVKETVIQTVVVEKEVQVAGETVVQTVVVEKEVQVAGETVVQTVVVEKAVEVVKEVAKEVQVEVTPTPVPLGYQEVPRSRTLIMAGLGGEHPGAFTDIEQFNAHAPGLSRSGLYQAASEGLFYFNMLTGELIPWMATEYEYDEGYTGVTVKIRDGVEWSDGTPFTAHDVAYTLNMANTNPLSDRHGAVNQWTDEAVAVDDLTVHVKFTGPSPRYVWDLLIFRADIGVPWIPKHIFENVPEDELATFSHYDPAKGWPVVTGPYRLVHTDVEKKIWDRRDDWWAAKIGFHDLPEVERLIFLPGMNEITMAQLLITNEIDMAFSLTVPNYKAVVAQNPNMTTHYYGEAPYGYEDWWPVGLGLNTKRPPFDNKNVRWAISYSINRDEVIEFGFGGGQIVQQLPWPYYAPMQKYHDEVADLLETHDTSEYSPEKSAALMEGEGYTRDGDGFWVKDGERVKIHIVTFPQHPSTTPAAPVVTQNLRRNGFDASFSTPTDFIDQIFQGHADGFIWGHGSMVDPEPVLKGYRCELVTEGDTGFIAYPGFYRWCNEEFDTHVRAMTALPEDSPGVLEHYRKAMEIWLPELPDIPLTSTIITLPMNTTYWKEESWPHNDNQYIHEGFWHRTGLHIFLNLESVE
jgi:peptide/nickel transport system substrate-binding protein